MSTTIIKQLDPEPDQDLLGLQKYGFSIYPDAETVYEIPMLGGAFQLGLSNSEKKKYEDYFGVKFDTPEGQEFLSNYSVKISHEINIFDHQNLKSMFDLAVIKANKGFGHIAHTEEEITNSPIRTHRFFVTDEGLDQEQKATRKMAKAEAMSILTILNQKTSAKMLTIANYLFPHGGISKNKTVAFTQLYDYIEESVPNAEKFIEITQMEPAYLELVVTVRKSIALGIIRMGKDGYYAVSGTDSKLGRTESELISAFQKPENLPLLGEGKPSDLPYSVYQQLKGVISN